MHGPEQEMYFFYSFLSFFPRPSLLAAHAVTDLSVWGEER
jgi:hypothetical protein